MNRRVAKKDPSWISLASQSTVLFLAPLLDPAVWSIVAPELDNFCLSIDFICIRDLVEYSLDYST